MGEIRHLLQDDDLSSEEQRIVLDVAAHLVVQPRAAEDALHGAAIGLLFEKPSLRTRVSSEVACASLGALPVQLRADELQLVRGETPEDSARVLAGYLSLLLARVNAHVSLQRLASPEAIPVVNGLSDRFHPLQALADLLTLRQEFGTIAGRRLAYVGDGNNVASSLLLACSLAGVDVSMACPAGYEPPEEVVTRAAELGLASGAAVSVIRDPWEAVEGADAVYTDVWTSMGQEGEEDVRTSTLAPYQVNADLVDAAPEHAIVLHCLPAHRGEEITDDVMESPRARVFRQAHNRLPATGAALLFLLDPGMAGRLAREAPWEEDLP